MTSAETPTKLLNFTEEQVPPPQQSNAKKLGFIVLGLLLVAAVVFSVLAFLRSGQPVATPAPTVTVTVAPTATATPTPNASPTASATPAPAATATEESESIFEQANNAANNPEPIVPAFTSFQPSGAAVVCNDDSESYPITFSWSSENATAAWFGIDTNNAQAAPFAEVGTNDSITWDFYCSNAQTTYTVTLADDSGNLTHRSVVVERQ